MWGPCLGCKRYQPLDKCHIKSKGSGGGSGSDNILQMCRLCHQESHRLGWGLFTEKHPNVKAAITERGWTIQKRGTRLAIFKEHK